MRIVFAHFASGIESTWLKLSEDGACANNDIKFMPKFVLNANNYGFYISSQNGTLKASGNVLPFDDISTNDDDDDDDDDEDGTFVSMKLQGALLSDGSGSDNSFR